jgi:hypothetical protein
VNETACPVTGAAGLYVNEAARAATTVSVWLTLFESEELEILNVTVYDAGVEKA